MADSPVSRLRMFAGPNGSGKTTIARTLGREHNPLGAFSLHYYINADDIQTALAKPEGLELSNFGLESSLSEFTDRLTAIGRLSHDAILAAKFELKDGVLRLKPGVSESYVAAAVADVIRYNLLQRGESLTFETVMSHRSKVDFLAEAKRMGYRTYLYYVATAAPKLNVSRVKNRYLIGGHDVPPIKIRQRYERSLNLLSAALANADRGYIFDNSGEEFRLLSELHPDRHIELHVPPSELPAWYSQYAPQSLLG